MHIKNFRNNLFGAATLLLAMTTAGCSMVTDEPNACPAQLRVRFVYDYNLKFADAFANEVKSVNIWAFDSDGKLVWSDAANGEELAENSFYLETPLTEGRYDFVSWCGLKDNESFNLATYTPDTKEELEITLKTISENGESISKNNLPGLYHGMVKGVTYDIDPFSPTFKTVTIPLMKDTKDIRIMLQHLDGSEIDNRDFSVSITDRNAKMSWNNTIMPTHVIYKPWNIKYGQASAPGSKDTKAMTSVASLLFELSTGRLMESSDAVLTVHRNWDNQDIIRIPLIDYLLLVRGHYGNISDQEYLDRMDDTSMVFFIDKNSNWYMSAGIFINDWAVVPPQQEPI